MTQANDRRAEALAASADESWCCRWCGARTGVRVLDAGQQPAADFHPQRDAPAPDPEHPLVMVMCLDCRLLQLEFDPTTPEEPRRVEPAALVQQAETAIEEVVQAGLLRRGQRVLEYASPHGGSWAGLLAGRGLTAVHHEPAEVIIDIFGMMHAPNQRGALEQRVAQLADEGVLLLQFHTAAAILATGTWNALRHGHFAYYSSPVLVAMAAELGMVAVDAWSFPLYGGTVLIAFRHAEGGTVEPAAAVSALLAEEEAAGVLDPDRARSLNDALDASTAAIRDYLNEAKAQGVQVAGYGAASRATALLRCAQVTPLEVVAVADASVGLQGRAMPGARIPIVAPAELIVMRPDRVLLFVPDLLAEVRAALPEIEANGGRWVVVDPMPREVEPVWRVGSQ